MTRNLTESILFIVLLLPCLTHAQDLTLEEQEANEIREFEVYKDILISVDAVKHILRSERDHMRPSDWVEKGSGAVYSGEMLRGAHKILLDLTKGMDPLPQYWGERYGEFTKNRGKVRKAIAAVSALATMVDAARNAETSSSEEKLMEMSELVKDVTAIFKVNPVIKSYIKTMTMAIEDIAGNAAIIEAANKRTNETIEDIRKNLGITDYSRLEVERNPLQDAIDAADARIEELKRNALRRADDEAYGRISEAEEACAKSRGTTAEGMNENRRSLETDRSVIRKIKTACERIKADIKMLGLMVAYTEKSLAEQYGQSVSADGSNAIAVKNKINRIKEELKVYQEAEKLAKREGPRQYRDLQDKFLEVSKRAKSTRRKLADYDECVKDKLADAGRDVADIIDRNFPQYDAGTGIRIPVEDPTSAAIAANDLSGAKGFGCLDKPSPPVKGQARNGSWFFEGSLQANGSMTKPFTVPRGTEIFVKMIDLKGRAKLYLYCKMQTKNGIEWVSVNSRNLLLYWGPNPIQEYKIVVVCGENGPAIFGIEVKEWDRGDLGLSLDAGGEDTPVLDLAFGKEYTGYLSGNDREDVLRLAYLQPHTRVRVTFAVQRIGVPKNQKAWERIRLGYNSISCDSSGKQTVLTPDENILVGHGRESFVDFITDRPSHYHIILRSEYGGHHVYQIKAELLEPIPVYSSGKLMGYLGETHNCWYIKRFGDFMLQRWFKTQQEARENLLKRP